MKDVVLWLLAVMYATCTMTLLFLLMAMRWAW